MKEGQVSGSAVLTKITALEEVAVTAYEAVDAPHGTCTSLRLHLHDLHLHVHPPSASQRAARTRT
jgi:hypothetical protein